MRLVAALRAQHLRVRRELGVCEQPLGDVVVEGAPLEVEEEELGLDLGVPLADALDEGYSPPERPSALVREGPHETLDQRLSEEIPEPDPYADDDIDEEDNLTVRADEERLDDGEVGDVRAGRLVDPNEGIGPDVDKDLVGLDVGIDGGAASAEEAAMHVVPD